MDSKTILNPPRHQKDKTHSQQGERFSSVSQKRGVLENVAPSSSRRCQWVLAERAAELAPLAPTPALQVTEEMELALAILERLGDPPSTKELARKVLDAQELPVTTPKIKACALRLKFMLLKYQRRSRSKRGSESCKSKQADGLENWRSKYVPLVKKPLKKMSDGKKPMAWSDTTGSEHTWG